MCRKFLYEMALSNTFDNSKTLYIIVFLDWVSGSNFTLILTFLLFFFFFLRYAGNLSVYYKLTIRVSNRTTAIRFSFLFSLIDFFKLKQFIDNIRKEKNELRKKLIKIMKSFIPIPLAVVLLTFIWYLYSSFYLVGILLSLKVIIIFFLVCLLPLASSTISVTSLPNVVPAFYSILFPWISFALFEMF